MESHARQRSLLLAILIVLAAGSAAAADAAPFRRWGLGWGNWSQDGIDYYGGNGPGIRYRTPGGWTFTAAGYFSTDEIESHRQRDYWWYDDSEEVAHSDP